MMSRDGNFPTFKGVIKRGVQQQPPNQSRTPENVINRASTKTDLYKQVTSQLSSQQFQTGDLRRNQQISIPISKKRNSILEMQCEQDMQPPIQQYYGGGTQRSMLNSNVAESLFQSKLHQTKGQLCEQMTQLQKRMRRQIQKDRGLIEDFLSRVIGKFTQKSKQEQRKNFDLIVNQLNKNLNTASKKQKHLENGLAQNQQKLTTLQKQFSDFSVQTEEKLQKIMNSNSQVANSMRKSLSRNMGNVDYMVELKNSIKEPVLNNGLVEQIRGEIHDLQQALRSIKFQLTYVKEELKTKTLAPAENQKPKPELVQATKLNMLAEQINSIKNQLQYLETQESSTFKFKQLRTVLSIQEQNYIGINDAFQKAVNINILPRVKRVEDQVHSQSIERNTEYLKKQVIKQLESMPIIRVKPITEEEKEKLDRMKNLPKSQQQTYMLDDLNYILDCFGNYLLDQNNQRIRLQEDQIYYLEQVEGIQIKMPIDVK